jgi:hypothetical protein
VKKFIPISTTVIDPAPKAEPVTTPEKTEPREPTWLENLLGIKPKPLNK